MEYKNERVVATALSLLKEQEQNEGHKVIKVDKKDGMFLIRAGYGENEKNVSLKLEDEKTVYQELLEASCAMYPEKEPELIREGSMGPGYSMRAYFKVNKEEYVISFTTNDPESYDWSERLIQDQQHSIREADRGSKLAK